MAKRSVFFCSVVALCAVVIGGCGSSTSTKPTTGPAPLVITVSDVPVCNLIAFRSIVNGLTLTNQAGSSVTVINSNQTVPLDFASLRDTSAVLNITSITPDTYTKGTITLIASSMSLFDPSLSPVITQVTPTLSSETVTFNINPPLVVPPCPLNSSTPCSAAALNIDYNLDQSIPVDAQGQVVTAGSGTAASVKVTPAIVGTPLTAGSSQGFGQIDNIHGYILSVNNSPVSNGSENFIGSFVIQTQPGTETISALSGAGPALTVNLKSVQALNGVAALNQLTTGNFVEIDGYVDQFGEFIANFVMIEDQEDISQQFSTFIGPILSVVKDASGSTTEFTMSVTDEEPNTQSLATTGNAVALDSPPLTVNLSPTTGYHFSAPGVNYANVTPDPSLLAVGQRIVVHGTYVPPPTQNAATTLAATNVYIPLQTASGKYVSLLAAGSDNLTGGFVFLPCAGFFAGQPLYVITSGVAPANPTQFINVNGLAGLTPAPQLLVRGLLFFDTTGGTINGIQIPPNSYVMLASRVHQP